MDDMISRAAAIDALDIGCELLRRALDDTDVVGVERAKYEWGLGLIESYIADIKELPSAQPQWIPVSERLPEEYKDVLCYYEYFRYGDYNCMFRTIDRGYYGNGIWGGEAGQGHKNKVLAWMPLPDPWRGEQG